MRAHEIWERQGRPEGQHEAHWDQARREVEMEDEDAGSLQRTISEAMGAAAGMDPGATGSESTGHSPVGPAEGDRGVVERQLARKDSRPSAADSAAGRRTTGNSRSGQGTARTQDRRKS